MTHHTNERRRTSGPNQTDRTADGSQQPSDDAVAERAYEIYRGRGGDDGHDLDDWLTAEAELRGTAREER